MRFVLYTGALSEHQLPLAREIARRVGEDRFRYVYTNTHGQSFQAGAANEPWIAFGPHPWLESADVMLTGMRDADLFARRAAKGLKTFYMSERWFKPALGIGRLLCLPYFRMARRLVRLMASGKLVYLPMGVWAARDMARLAGLLAGDARCLFRAPAVSFAPEPLGAVAGFPWMRMWGYFVAPSDAARARQADADLGGRALRVLWVGRLLAWKRVDTLFKAAAACLEKFSLALTVVGDGPERARLERLGRRLFAGRPGVLDFRHSVPIGEVRTLMRAHDVYVLPSNGYEGWGAVVSEALEEGMSVLGTFEAGASATMLPKERLFRAGDWRALARLLEKAREGALPPCAIGDWTAANAAERLACFMTCQERERSYLK